MGSQPKPNELLWHRIHNMRNAGGESLISRLFKFSLDTYSRASLDEAWSEFHQWSDEPFDPDSDLLPVFMPWFYYEWTPDVEPAEESDLPDVPPALHFMKTRGYRLDDLERQYITACLAYPLSFFEVEDCDPGAGYRLKDIFTEEVFDVVEKSGSRHARRGDIIFGKPATVSGLTTLEACAPILIPPIHKGPLIELRKRIACRFRPITKAALAEFGTEIIEQFQLLYDLIRNPQIPQLSNTDGDPFMLQKVIYEIESAQKVFDALKFLNFQDSEEELLREAKYGKKGELLFVEFSWLKKGNRKHKGMTNTVLGHITVTDHGLTVEVNSEKRAAMIRAEIEKRLPDGLKYRATLMEPIEAALNGRKKGPPIEESPEDSRQGELLEQHPEILEKIAEMNQAHWKSWPSIKVPALGNKTPKQAAKTKDGKEMLEALLTQFERASEDRPQPGATVETFEEIRVELGLPKRKG